MLLALVRFMTETVAGPITPELLQPRHRDHSALRYATVQVGEVALTLLEMLGSLNDDNKWFLLDCLSDLAWAMANKNRLAQHEVVLFVLQQHEELLCREPNQLVNRLLDFVVRVGSYRVSQRECAALFRVLRKHGYPAHLLRAARRMVEKSRTPPLVELSLSQGGYASVQLLAGTVSGQAGTHWPPQNGWTLACWLCVEAFDGRAVGRRQ